MSTKKKITITRALVELKRYDEKARTLIAESQAFVATGDNKRVPNTTFTEAERSIQASIDSVTAAIQNAEAIRNAIHKSNAVTKVTLGDKDMTVAEAINLKKTVSLKEVHLSRLNTLRQSAIVTAARANEAVEAEINKRALALAGKDAKLTDAELEVLRRNVEGASKAEVVGLSIFDNQIKALKDEIELINSELDFTLSESNARTEIEI